MTKDDGGKDYLSRIMNVANFFHDRPLSCSTLKDYIQIFTKKEFKHNCLVFKEFRGICSL